MPQIFTTIASIRDLLKTVRAEGKTVALVPTMGALHKGHLSLVRIARENADYVVASIFVNPSQFAPGEDFGKYPRMLDKDAEKLGSVGADAVFAPDITGMYPEGFKTWVTVDELTGVLCGESRPLHFRGVTTIVAKLLNIIRPDVAVFGKKDAQQLAVIRRMVRDLDMGSEIIGAEIIREEDGLAKSSRNRYLTPDERHQSSVLYKSLMKARALVDSGESDSLVVVNAVRETINSAALAEIEYIEIVDTDEMTSKEKIEGNTLLALAVRFGTTRLIDNIVLSDAAS